jgi:predicted AAA+ superfamily ATPase
MAADSHKKHKVTQTNVFFVQPGFYKEYLAGAYAEANDALGRFIEHVVYERLLKAKALDKVELFRENPEISGFSGSYGGTLQRNKYKMILRNLERKFLRACGIHQFLIEY